MIRIIFDATLEKYPELSKYLEVDAAIMQAPRFESGMIKIQNGQDETLTMSEVRACRRLLLPPVVQPHEDIEGEGEGGAAGGGGARVPCRARAIEAAAAGWERRYEHYGR